MGFELQSRLLTTQNTSYISGTMTMSLVVLEKPLARTYPLCSTRTIIIGNKEVKAAEGKMEGGGVGAPFCQTAASRGASPTT